LKNTFLLNHYGKDALMHLAIWLREFVAKGQWIQEYERKHCWPRRTFEATRSPECHSSIWRSG